MPSLCTSMSDPTRKLTSFSLAGKVTSLVLYFWVHMNLSYKHMYIFIFSSNAHVHHIYFHACLACFLLSEIICRNMMDVFMYFTHQCFITAQPLKSNLKVIDNISFFSFLPLFKSELKRERNRWQYSCVEQADVASPLYHLCWYVYRLEQLSIFLG